MNTRRTVTAALIFATPAFLAACGTPASQVQTDADLVTATVLAFAPVARLKASPADQARIDAGVAAVQAADKALATATGQQAKLEAESLVAAVQGIAPIAIALLPADSVAAMSATAALSLLPAVLRAAGVQLVAASRARPMSEAQARVIARGLK